MSNVVELKAAGRRPAVRHRARPDASGTILIFTGVRYERSPDRIDLAERVVPRRPQPQGKGRRGSGRA